MKIDIIESNFYKILLLHYSCENKFTELIWQIFQSAAKLNQIKNSLSVNKNQMLKILNFQHFQKFVKVISFYVNIKRKKFLIKKKN